MQHGKVRRHIPQNARLGWAWIAAIILAAFVVRLPLVWLPIKFDEAIFAHMGNMWLCHGQRLYVDVIDNKPPGVFLVDGALFKLTRHLDIASPRLASAVFIAAAGVLLALLGARTFSRAAGILAGLCLVTFSAIVIAPPAYTETFMLPFTTAAG